MVRKLGPPPKASSEAVHKSMVSNRGKNTGPEQAIRVALRERGLRGYRLNWNRAPGRPDIAFPRQRVAVFVNGCYWHRCPYCNLKVPKTHRDYWTRKFELNIERDKRKRRELKKAGWRVIVVWECQIKKRLDAVATRVETAVRDRMD